MKRLIVCFDGTWNAADSENSETNVARIARAIRANSGNETSGEKVPQLVLYLRGVGTSGSELQRLIAGATGAGVEENIRSAYMFLAQNYQPERVENGVQLAADEIFLFGFSRGAFSARSLAGFMSATGLLKRQSLGHVMRAWSYYRETRSKRSPQGFIEKNPGAGIATHDNVTVKFLGVWDTVGALGVPVGLLSHISAEMHGFHDTTPSRIVKHGVQALAIDETRDPFVPTLWTGRAPEECRIEQVWFPGCHSDIGGGYQDGALAAIPLEWMAQTAEADGLRLDWSLLPKRQALDTFAPIHDPREGIYLLDKLTPTIRRVCGKDVEVSFFERLYAPLDRNGKPLPTINERLHASVIARFGNEGWLSTNDKTSGRKRGVYRPRNIDVLFDGSGKLKKDIRSVT